MRPSRQGFAPNLQKARSLKTALLNELGEIPSNGVRATFADAVGEYLQHIETIKLPSTVVREASSIKANLVPTLGTRLLKDITVQDCQRTLDEAATGKSTQTYRHLRNQLRWVFERAKKRGLVSYNPASDTENHRIKRKDPLVLNEIQVKRLLQYLKEKHPLIFYHVAIAVHTCCRAGELRALTFSDVDFKNRRITVAKTLDPQSGIKGMTENLQSRRIPINDELMAILLELNSAPDCHPTDPILPYWREFYNNEQAKVLKQVCHVLGFPEITFHDLRATGITLLLDKGVSVPKVMLLAGHKRLSSTEIYLRLAGVDSAGATDAMRFGLFE